MKKYISLIILVLCFYVNLSQAETVFSLLVADSNGNHLSGRTIYAYPDGQSPSSYSTRYELSEDATRLRYYNSSMPTGLYDVWDQTSGNQEILPDESFIKVEDINTNSAALDSFVRKDGSEALTANWDAGSYQIRMQTGYFDATSGQPIEVLSTDKVINFNADLIDGTDGSQIITRDGTKPLLADWNAGSYTITANQFISDTSLVDTLNVKYLEGYTAAALLDSIDNAESNIPVNVLTTTNEKNVVGKSFKTDAVDSLRFRLYDSNDINATQYLQFVLDNLPSHAVSPTNLFLEFPPGFSNNDTVMLLTRDYYNTLSTTLSNKKLASSTGFYNNSKDDYLYFDLSNFSDDVSEDNYWFGVPDYVIDTETSPGDTIRLITESYYDQVSTTMDNKTIDYTNSYFATSGSQSMYLLFQSGGTGSKYYNFPIYGGDGTDTIGVVVENIISDNENLGSSTDSLVTQRAIKTYVDNNASSGTVTATIQFAAYKLLTSDGVVVNDTTVPVLAKEAIGGATEYKPTAAKFTSSDEDTTKALEVDFHIPSEAANDSLTVRFEGWNSGAGSVDYGLRYYRQKFGNLSWSTSSTSFESIRFDTTQPDSYEYTFTISNLAGSTFKVFIYRANSSGAIDSYLSKIIIKYNKSN